MAERNTALAARFYELAAFIVLLRRLRVPRIAAQRVAADQLSISLVVVRTFRRKSGRCSIFLNSRGCAGLSGRANRHATCFTERQACGPFLGSRTGSPT